MNTKENKNPVLCGIETGICGIPETTKPEEETNLSSPIKPIKIVNFTDSICSSSWRIEPSE
jgi:putative protein-disulfide isomerase